jgi:hypothetical protein
MPEIRSFVAGVVGSEGERPCNTCGYGLQSGKREERDVPR